MNNHFFHTRITLAAVFASVVLVLSATACGTARNHSPGAAVNSSGAAMKRAAHTLDTALAGCRASGGATSYSHCIDNAYQTSGFVAAIHNYTAALATAEGTVSGECKVSVEAERRAYDAYATITERIHHDQAAINMAGFITDAAARKQLAPRVAETSVARRAACNHS